MSRQYRESTPNRLIRRQTCGRTARSAIAARSIRDRLVHQIRVLHPELGVSRLDHHDPDQLLFGIDPEVGPQGARPTVVSDAAHPAVLPRAAPDAHTETESVSLQHLV